MRLLHTRRLEFEEFYGDDTPSFAILSHKWEYRQELTYQDWLALTPSARAKSGYSKICSACLRALQKQLDWIWIDTICINKDSSAELSEAINSMYAWYGAAEVCFAYLSDVPPLPKAHPEEDGKDLVDFRPADGEKYRDFRNSRWFSRGWTLQEMLAPKDLEFVAADWSDLGSRTRLALEIARVTNIDVFDCPKLVAQASVSRKMSWLSRRVTTRVEDMAYCMLGLFDINMPLLYGEGSKAFLRLQEEIIKRSPDQTIFCWSHNDATPPGWTGLLAPSPAAFTDAAPFSNRARWTTPYSITNQGLSIELPIVYTPHGAYVLLDVQYAGTFMPLLPVSPFGPDRWPYIRRPFPKGPVLTMVSRTLPYQQPKENSNPSLFEDPRGSHSQMPKYLSTLRRPLLLETVQNKLLQTTTLPRALTTSNKQHESMFVLLFMDTWLPKSLKFREQLSAEDSSSSRFPFYDVVPATVHFEPTSGIMGLEVYQRDDRTILASCLQLYTNPKHYPAARIFWAIEHKSDNGGVADFRHYCAIEEYRPGTVAMEKMFNGDRQEAWFSKKLQAVLDGEVREQPQDIGKKSAQMLSLRIMPTLGKSGDDRFLLAVLSKKDTTGNGGLGAIRSIFSEFQS